MNTASPTTEVFELTSRRWLLALFLLVWLSGWAAGEVAVLALLGGGALAVVKEGRTALSLGGLGVACFLLAWLALWTVGGLAALRELGRSLAGKDQLQLSPAGLRLRALPFGRWRTLARQDIAQLHLHGQRGALWLWTAQGEQLCVTDLGTADEREALLLRLQRALDLDPRPRRSRLPPGWLELPTNPGEDAVRVQPPGGARRLGGGLVVLLSVAVGAIAALRPSGLTPLVLALALGGLAWAAWLLGWRREWTVRPGQLVLGWRGPFEAAGDALAPAELRVERSTDSDGDVWYALSAVVHGKPRALASPSRDELVPRWLGDWLGERLGVPVRDVG